MKIKVKLILFSLVIVFLSLSFITVLFVFKYSFSVFDSEIKHLEISLKRTESFFYDYLSQLNRVAGFLSELREISDNLDKPRVLSIYLQQKDSLFPSSGVEIFRKNGEKVLSYLPSGVKCKLNISSLIREKKQVVRLSGIFPYHGKLCFLSLTPIVDPTSLRIKGYLALERPIDSGFADYLKERVREEVFILNGQGELLGSTYIGEEGERIFPSRVQKWKGAMKGEIEGRLFLMKGVDIKCMGNNVCGKLILGKDETEVLSVHRGFLKYILVAFGLDLIFALLLTLILSRHFIKPITALSRAGERWAWGDLDYKLNLKRKDEFGKLAETFNSMALQLKEKRDELEKTKAFYQTIINRSPTGVLVCNPSGKVQEMNSSAKEMFGDKLKKGDNLFLSIRGFERIKEKCTSALLQNRAQEIYGLEAEVGGKNLILKVLIYPVERDGEPVLIVQVEDITRKKEMEKELLHLRKLAMIGTRLTSYAHDINNYLTTILGHLEILDLRLSDYYLKEEVYQIKNATRNAAKLSRSLLDFSRERTRLEEVNLNEVIDSTVNFIKKILPESIKLKVEKTEEGLKVMGDPSKLSVSLYNLIINSMDAILMSGKKNGNIILEVTSEYDPVSGKHFAKVVVEDNGVGIERKDINRVFEPYFTTKGSEGTGLGLYMVKSTVEEIGGKISVESQPGQWTRFTIYLPISSSNQMEGK